MSFEIIIQGFVAVIIIGITYSLWSTSKVYGGLIGASLRWIGLGILFFSLETLDRVLGDLSFVNSLSADNAELLHYLLLFLGLSCSGIGFSRLTKIAK